MQSYFCHLYLEVNVGTEKQLEHSYSRRKGYCVNHILCMELLTQFAVSISIFVEGQQELCVCCELNRLA